MMDPKYNFYMKMFWYIGGYVDDGHIETQRCDSLQERLLI